MTTEKIFIETESLSLGGYTFYISRFFGRITKVIIELANKDRKELNKASELFGQWWCEKYPRLIFEEFDPCKNPLCKKAVFFPDYPKREGCCSYNCEILQPKIEAQRKLDELIKELKIRDEEERKKVRVEIKPSVKFFCHSCNKVVEIYGYPGNCPNCRKFTIITTVAASPA